MSARPVSTPASCCTCPTIPKKARSAAGTSPGPRASPCPGRLPREPPSGPPPGLGGSSQDEGGLRPEDAVLFSCRIGERSSHTWFVLHHLLGYPHVRNYDGSWTEWGNSVRVPIPRGENP